MLKSTRSKIVAAPFVAAAMIFYVIDPMDYFKVALHVFAIPAICYPLVYRNSPWRSGPTGKALMNKAIAVALLFCVAILKIHRPFPGDDYVLGAMVTYLGVAVTYQFVVMFRLKQNARSVREPQPEEV